MVTESVSGFIQLNAGRLVSIMLLSCIATTVLRAQETENPPYRYYGFEAHFGVNTTRIVSDFIAIHNMDVLDEGGSLGFVFGNRVIKTRLQMAGFYYSSSRVKHTVNIIT